MKRFPAATLAAFVLMSCAQPGDDTSGAADSGATTIGSPTAGAAHMPSDADRDAILATAQALFDALRERDGSILREIVHPTVVMHSVEGGSNGDRSISTSTVDDLIARVEGSEQVLTERMWDPEVRISGDLAMVWTPYDFYVGDTLSHCGGRCVRADPDRRRLADHGTVVDEASAAHLRAASGRAACLR